jgi:hypothetical protein
MEQVAVSENPRDMHTAPCCLLSYSSEQPALSFPLQRILQPDEGRSSVVDRLRGTA